jgi:hypothetical protein
VLLAPQVHKVFKALQVQPVLQTGQLGQPDLLAKVQPAQRAQWGLSAQQALKVCEVSKAQQEDQLAQPVQQEDLLVHKV